MSIRSTWLDAEVGYSDSFLEFVEDLNAHVNKYQADHIRDYRRGLVVQEPNAEGVLVVRWYDTSIAEAIAVQNVRRISQQEAAS